MRTYHVYILASEKNGTLYVGMTSDLEKRLAQHRSGTFDGFTKKYRVTKLVHVEFTNDARTATERERRLKAWKREWKLRLIEKENPSWNDLAIGVSGSLPSQG